MGGQRTRKCSNISSARQIEVQVTFYASLTTKDILRELGFNFPIHVILIKKNVFLYFTFSTIKIPFCGVRKIWGEVRQYVLVLLNIHTLFVVISFAFFRFSRNLCFIFGTLGPNLFYRGNFFRLSLSLSFFF